MDSDEFARLFNSLTGKQQETLISEFEKILAVCTPLSNKKIISPNQEGRS